LRFEKEKFLLDLSWPKDIGKYTLRKERPTFDMHS